MPETGAAGLSSIRVRPELGRYHAILAAIALLAFFIVPFLLFGERLEAFAQAFFQSDKHDAASMLVAGALLAADPILPTPSSAIATLLAAKVGFVLAALTNAATLSLACILGYFLGRGGGAILHRSGRAIPLGFALWVREYGLLAVLLCRPVPILAEASLIIAGAARHEKCALFGWCIATQSALGTAYAFAGSGWGKDQWSLWAIFAGSILLPLGGAIVVLIVMIRAKRRAQQAPKPL